MKKNGTLALLMGLFLWIQLPAQDPFSDDESPASFDDAKVIRVKYAAGESFVERENETGWEDLIENLPIFEGDFISTEAGRVELYLGRLNHLRLDHFSQLEIIRAPQLRSTFWTLQLLAGSVILDLEQLDVDMPASIRTPDCEVFFITPGVYRIDHRETGETVVAALEGSVQIRSDEGTHDLGRGESLIMRDRQVLSAANASVSAENDALMDFHRQRSRGESAVRSIGSRHLQDELYEFEPELSRHGRWEYSPVYGSSIWYPYGLAGEWQPYMNGRWTWHPVYGYTWTSYDPCGWITHHYGRWHWNPGHGWYWIPGTHWSPAWVYWGWSNDYYCWVPLGRNNRPVIVINKRWLRDYNHRQGLPIKASSVVVVHKSRFRSNRIGDFITRKVGSDLIEDRLHFRGRAPIVLIADPLLHGRTASGKTVLIKQSSIKRTPIDTTKPVLVPGRDNEKGHMEDSLRSVRKVIRKKNDAGIGLETAHESSPPDKVGIHVKKSGKTSSSPAKSGSGSKKVVKKKKGG